MTGKILIVDDVATNRIVLKVKLAAARYQTLQAGSGAEALRVIANETPDLILLEARLPRLPRHVKLGAVRSLLLPVPPGPAAPELPEDYALEPAEPVRRYERQHPGEIVDHQVDHEPLGRGLEVGRLGLERAEHGARAGMRGGVLGEEHRAAPVLELDPEHARITTRASDRCSPT